MRVIPACGLIRLSLRTMSGDQQNSILKWFDEPICRGGEHSVASRRAAAVAFPFNENGVSICDAVAWENLGSRVNEIGGTVTK